MSAIIETEPATAAATATDLVEPTPTTAKQQLIHDVTAHFAQFASQLCAPPYDIEGASIDNIVIDLIRINKHCMQYSSTFSIGTFTQCADSIERLITATLNTRWVQGGFVTQEEWNAAELFNRAVCDNADPESIERLIEYIEPRINQKQYLMSTFKRAKMRNIVIDHISFHADHDGFTVYYQPPHAYGIQFTKPTVRQLIEELQNVNRMPSNDLLRTDCKRAHLFNRARDELGL